MEGYCVDCKWINKKKRYGNVFDDNIRYGCKKLVVGYTKDEYTKYGDLVYYDTNPRCYEENLQQKMKI